MATNLYTKFGGAATISRVVRDYYKRMLADPALAHYFEGVDMDVLISHQMSFLAEALGGPEVYDGRDITTVHAGLGIDDAAFDAARHHLSAAVSMAGISDADRDQILDLIESVRDQIVSEKPST